MGDGGNISGARANLTWSFGSALRGRHHEVGWIGRRIVCQMMKTADYLAVTPLFSARALQTRDFRGERSCKLVYLELVLVFFSENEYH